MVTGWLYKTLLALGLVSDRRRRPRTGSRASGGTYSRAPQGMRHQRRPSSLERLAAPLTRQQPQEQDPEVKLKPNFKLHVRDRGWVPGQLPPSALGHGWRKRKGWFTGRDTTIP